MAARKNSIENEIRNLLKVSESLRKNNLTPEQCFRGANIAQVLEELKVEPDNFKTFVMGVYQEVVDRNFPVGTFVEYAFELGTLGRKTGKSYEQIVVEYAEKKEGIGSLDEGIIEFEKKRDDLRVNYNRELWDAKTSEEELKRFTEVRKRLEALGLSLMNLNTVEVLLSNFADFFYEPQSIIEFYTETNELRVRRQELEKAVNGLEVNRKNLGDDLEELEAKLKHSKSMVDAVEMLKSLSLTPVMIRFLVNRINAIAATHGFDHSEALDKFVSDVDNQYDDKLGFENQLKGLQSRKDILDEEIEHRKSRLEILDANYGERSQAVEAMLHLNQLGVSNDDLVTWRTILQENDIDLVSFRKGMKTQGGFTEYVAELQKTARALEIDIQSLVQEVENLQFARETHHKNMILASLKARTDVEDALQLMNQTIEKFDASFLNPETGFEAQTKKIVETTHTKLREKLLETEKEWQSNLNILRTDIQKTVRAAQEIKEAAFTGGREVGKFIALKPVHSIMEGKKIQKREALVAILSFLSHARAFMLMEKISIAERECKALMQAISRELVV